MYQSSRSGFHHSLKLTFVPARATFVSIRILRFLSDPDPEAERKFFENADIEPKLLFIFGSNSSLHCVNQWYSRWTKSPSREKFCALTGRYRNLPNSGGDFCRLEYIKILYWFQKYKPYFPRWNQFIWWTFDSIYRKKVIKHMIQDWRRDSQTSIVLCKELLH